LPPPSFGRHRPERAAVVGCYERPRQRAAAEESLTELEALAEAAGAAGWRAFIVDSYAARGWSRTFALAMVCTGILLRGHERAGDVLACIHAMSQRRDVDASSWRSRAGVTAAGRSWTP